MLLQCGGRVGEEDGRNLGRTAAREEASLRSQVRQRRKAGVCFFLSSDEANADATHFCFFLSGSASGSPTPGSSNGRETPPVMPDPLAGGNEQSKISFSLSFKLNSCDFCKPPVAGKQSFAAGEQLWVPLAPASVHESVFFRPFVSYVVPHM